MQPRKLAMWASPQLQHNGAFSAVFWQLFAACGPLHFTQRGGWPQFDDPWPNRWHELDQIFYRFLLLPKGKTSVEARGFQMLKGFLIMIQVR